MYRSLQLFASLAYITLLIIIPKMKHFTILILTVLSLFFLSSCIEENFSSNSDLKISFSIDTISFDTLISETASYTRTFKVHNNNKQSIKFSSVRLGAGEASNFRFNVNGYIPGDNNTLTDVEILGKDSIFVFVETTVPENDSVHILILDSLIFEYNTNISQVQLQAVGKNAQVLRNHSISGDVTFNGEKPYLIFNYLHVPFGSTLTITEGAELYFHSGANLIVDGNIRCIGSRENPITIAGDRFDRVDDANNTPYYYLPSQWGDIALQNTNGDHIFDHTNIRGSSMGILLLGNSHSSPKLKISNSSLHSFGAYGVYSQNGNLTIENTEISNCGKSCVYILGGEYYMAHSTIANYFRYAPRDVPACYITNYHKSTFSIQHFPISSAVVENSIIFGLNTSELILDKDTTSSADFNVLIANNLIKMKRVEQQYYLNNTWAFSQNNMGLDTVFVNTTYNKENGYYNFQLDSLSHAISRANTTVAANYPLDRLGVSRLSDDAPDLGAYEKVY